MVSRVGIRSLPVPKKAHRSSLRLRPWSGTSSTLALLVGFTWALCACGSPTAHDGAKPGRSPAAPSSSSASTSATATSPPVVPTAISYPHRLQVQASPTELRVNWVVPGAVCADTGVREPADASAPNPNPSPIALAQKVATVPPGGASDEGSVTWSNPGLTAGHAITWSVACTKYDRHSPTYEVWSASGSIDA